MRRHGLLSVLGLPGLLSVLGLPGLRRRDRGSATVLVVAAIATLLASGVGAMTLTGAVRASHQAHSAADLAALAGAMVLVRDGSGATACARAAVVARQNRGALQSCRAAGKAVIEVVVEAPTGTPGLGPAVARARAGPGRSAGSSAGPGPDRASEGALTATAAAPSAGDVRGARGPPSMTSRAGCCCPPHRRSLLC